MSDPIIVFHNEAFAETRALSALAYDLKSMRQSGSFPHQVYFYNRSGGKHTNRLLEEHNRLNGKQPTLRVGTYSGMLSTAELQIDIALIKNCSEPISEVEKQKRKEDYGLDADKKITSFVNGNFIVRDGSETSSESAASLFSFAIGTSQYSIPYIFDSKNLFIESAFSNKGVRFVDEYGILKERLSISDATINIGRSGLAKGNLHNFFEMTEHGPLFMIPEVKDWKYLGFTELVERGSIKTFSNFSSLESAVMDYLALPSDRTHTLSQRASYIKDSREKYLPIIGNAILACAKKNPLEHGISSELASLDLKGLKLKKLKRGPVILYHPNSDWEEHDDDSISSDDGIDGKTFLNPQIIGR